MQVTKPGFLSYFCDCFVFAAQPRPLLKVCARELLNLHVAATFGNTGTLHFCSFLNFGSSFLDIESRQPAEKMSWVWEDVKKMKDHHWSLVAGRVEYHLLGNWLNRNVHSRLNSCGVMKSEFVLPFVLFYAQCSMSFKSFELSFFCCCVSIFSSLSCFIRLNYSNFCFQES